MFRSSSGARREPENPMTGHLTQLIVFVLMAVDAVLPAGGDLGMGFASALAAGAVAGHPGPPPDRGDRGKAGLASPVLLRQRSDARLDHCCHDTRRSWHHGAR